MTPQVAERLLYESEAALRLVDTLLAELEEDRPERAPHSRLDSAGSEFVPASLVLAELAILHEDLAEKRGLVERAAAGDASGAAADAVRALRSAAERIDTVSRRIELRVTSQS